MKNHKSEWIAEILSIPKIKHEQVVILHRKFMKTGMIKYRDAILLAHLRQAINLANHYALKLSDDLFWDLINASSLSIITAINKWDPDRGVYFYKFVKTFIWRACYNTFHNYNNATHHASSLTLSIEENTINFNEILELYDSDKNLTENHKIDQISSWDHYTFLTAALTKREKKIIDLYILDELPWIKISKIMKMSPKKMLDVHRKIFTKIREQHKKEVKCQY